MELEREERKLVRGLIEALEENAPADEPIPTKDLSEAIIYYLGSIHKEEDEVLAEPLFRIDGIPLRHSERTLHLCLLDQGSMPSSSNVIPWPLTESSLRAIAHHDAARVLLERHKESVSASLYLFYCALPFADGSD